MLSLLPLRLAGFMVVTHHEGAEESSHFLCSESTVCLRQVR